jgi:hypothetical protein
MKKTKSNDGEPTVRCNMCYWKGEEDDLEILEDGLDVIGDKVYMKACPKCLTDDYLIDMDITI